MQFDRVARYYHLLEILFAGNLMQRCRTAYIEQTKRCRHALLVGEGHGRFLEALLVANPEIQVTFVERSSKMIAYARNRLLRQGFDLSRVTFQNSSLMDCEWPDTKFDLLVTHFFLDCLKPFQIRRAVQVIARSSSPGATWLLADFCIPETGWRRWRATGILLSLYVFFRLSANVSANWLTPPEKFLIANGFALHARQRTSFGLAHSDLWRRQES